MQYSEATIYGFNLIIKEYAKYPKCLPLPAHFEHGWTIFTNALKTDLRVDKPVMLVWSKRRLEAWKKASSKPAYIIAAPFMHYKNARKITKDPDSRGTVVFPSHSTADVKAVFDVESYAFKLHKLPSKFHPITVCLFWPDYTKDNISIYRKYGFKVTSAGANYKKGLDFVKNFYKILRSHRFATSNDVGSYSFYAVDLGVPFFLTGPQSKYKNVAKNQDINGVTRNDQEFYGRKAIKIFSTGPTDKISPEHKKFVEDEIGSLDCISPTKLRTILFEKLKSQPNYLKYILIYWLVCIASFIGVDRLLLSKQKNR